MEKKYSIRLRHQFRDGKADISMRGCGLPQRKLTIGSLSMAAVRHQSHASKLAARPYHHSESLAL